MKTELDMTVSRLHNTDINRTKWDDCVRQSFNTQVYGYAWYLDAVCDDWEALVYDDYLMVLPIPVTRRMGVRLISNPMYLPFVTIYSRVKPTAQSFYDFFEALPYSNVKLQLMPFNGFPQFLLLPPSKFKMISFDLIVSYQSAVSRFESLFNNSAYADCRDQITVARTQNINEYMLFRSINSPSDEISESYLRRLISYALRFKSISIFFAYDNTNMPIAALAMVKSDNRLTIIDSIYNKNAKGSCGLYRILLHLVKIHSESNLVLCFPVDGLDMSVEAEPFSMHGVQYRKGVVRFITS